MSQLPPPAPGDEDELAGTEQPFVAHLVELRNRIIYALLAVLFFACLLGIFPGAKALYDLLAAPLVASLPQGATLISIDRKSVV